MRPSTTLIGWALAAIVGALLVSPALGVTRPDDRAGPLGVGAASVATQPTHPNDLAGPLGAGAASIDVQPTHPNDREGPLGVGAVVGVSEPTVVPAVESPSGRDWGRITLGVAIVALLALAAGGAAVTLREHGGPGRPVPH